MTDLTSSRPPCGCCSCEHVSSPEQASARYACPHCGCFCPLPDPDECEGNPDACPCCRRDTSPDLGPVVHTDDLTYVVGSGPVVIDGQVIIRHEIGR